MLPKDLTAEQVQEVMEHMERWDKKVVQKHGYFFKRIGNNEVEIFTEAENEFWNYKLPKKKKSNKPQIRR